MGKTQRCPNPKSGVILKGESIPKRGPNPKRGVILKGEVKSQKEPNPKRDVTLKGCKCYVQAPPPSPPPPAKKFFGYPPSVFPNSILSNLHFIE